MQYRRLGLTECEISEISLGTWLTTYDSAVDVKTAKSCIRCALDNGVNFIDTANIYGLGAAESFLASALADVPRDKVVLATKLFFPMTATDQGLSRQQVGKQLDASLKRLNTDYIDLYQCHRYDPNTPIEETMEALAAAVTAGKVRFIGFSEWPLEAIRVAMDFGGEQFVSSQPQYSMLCRRPEHEIFPVCAEFGISQITYSPLAQGILTGKYHPGDALPLGSRAESSTMGKYFRRDLLKAPILEAVQKTRPLAAEAGLSLAQFAIAWILRRKEISAVLVGATSADQLLETLDASGKPVSEELFAEANRILEPFKNASR